MLWYIIDTLFHNIEKLLYYDMCKAVWIINYSEISKNSCISSYTEFLHVELYEYIKSLKCPIDGII